MFSKFSKEKVCVAWDVSADETRLMTGNAINARMNSRKMLIVDR